MIYTEAVDFINSASMFGIKLGLTNIGKLLELLGNPQDNLKVVHVAGTNGKGSVCAYITSILMAAGYKTGLFTSPYLEKFTERIQVDFENIPEDKLIDYVLLLQKKIKIMTAAGFNHPTFFELNTAIAFMYFDDMKCDAVVLETGLGGRFDSTNIIKNPIVSVITTIGYDHMTILGDTLDKIAFEKAGIIKQGRPVVLYGGNDYKAVTIIEKKAAEQNSELTVTDFDNIENTDIIESGYTFDYKRFIKQKINLLGKHQIKNACVAIEAAGVLNENGYELNNEKIREGLENTRWPGRIEVLNDNPVIICDATHNPQGAEVLKETLLERFAGKRIIYVMGVMKDKSFEEMAGIVLPGAAGVVTVTPNWHRALEASVLLETVKKHCNNAFAGDTIKEAMETALDMAGKDGIICTFGSLYYIADVKKFVREIVSGH